MTIRIIAEAAQGYEGNFNLTEMLLKAAASSKADARKKAKAISARNQNA